MQGSHFWSVVARKQTNSPMAKSDFIIRFEGEICADHTVHPQFVARKQASGPLATVSGSVVVHHGSGNYASIQN